MGDHKDHNLPESELPIGWFKAGSDPQDYDMALDRSVAHSGSASAVVKSAVKRPRGFGTLMQNFKADIFRGKRLRMSGYVKTSEVRGSAQLWMRIDGPDDEMLGFDNMGDRRIRGDNDWALHEIVLDVPEESIGIAFGIILSGSGCVWVDDFEFQEVGPDVSTTGGSRYRETPSAPVNLRFDARREP